MFMSQSFRAIVLIDNGYLSAILRDEFNLARIDYLLLSEEISKQYYRLRTYVYDALPYQSNPPTPYQSQLLASKQKFFHSLGMLPSFKVRLGKQRPRGNSYVQKGVDILLAIDLISLSSKQQIQKAFLIAGDADYVPVVDAAKDEGVKVTLYHSEALQTTPEGLQVKKYSDELWQACDQREPITKQLIDKVLKQTRPY
jgi:uncharacterized LabA/DUF88 family protein